MVLLNSKFELFSLAMIGSTDLSFFFPSEENQAENMFSSLTLSRVVSFKPFSLFAYSADQAIISMAA